MQKIDQQEFRIEKVIKKKETSYMSNGKDEIANVWPNISKEEKEGLKEIRSWNQTLRVQDKGSRFFYLGQQ